MSKVRGVELGTVHGSVHAGCFLPGSVPKGNGGTGSGPLQSK